VGTEEDGNDDSTTVKVTDGALLGDDVGHTDGALVGPNVVSQRGRFTHNYRSLLYILSIIVS
jgi:hypothetical protein